MDDENIKIDRWNNTFLQLEMYTKIHLTLPRRARTSIRRTTNNTRETLAIWFCRQNTLYRQKRGIFSGSRGIQYQMKWQNILDLYGHRSERWLETLKNIKQWLNTIPAIKWEQKGKWPKQIYLWLQKQNCHYMQRKKDMVKFGVRQIWIRFLLEYKEIFAQLIEDNGGEAELLVKLLD